VCGDDLAKYSTQNLEQMALDARNKGNFSAGIAFIDEVVKREPNNLGAHSSRGRLLFDFKDTEGALKEFDFVLEALGKGQQWPGVELAHLFHRKAYTLLALRRYAEAAIAVDAALALDPKYLNAWNTRGIIFKDLGKPEEAFKSYKAAVKISPQFLNAETNLINLAIELKAYDEARTYCSQMKSGGARAEAGVVSGELDATALEDKTPVNQKPGMLYWNCSVAFHEDGSHEEEYQEFLGLAASAPVYDAQDFFYRAEAKRALSQVDGALADYTESLSRDARQLDAYRSKGRLLYDQKRYEEAETLYSEFIDAHPNEALAHQGRATTRISLGQVKEALPDAQRGAELGANEAYTWQTLGWIHHQMGDLSAAQEAYQKVLALDPKSNSPRAFLAFRHQEKGDFTQVIDMLKPLVDSGQADAQELSRYGYGLSMLGRHDEALDALSASISKDPSNAYAFSQRAYVLASLGRIREAHVDADKARQLDPTNPKIIADAEFYRKEVDGYAKGSGVSRGRIAFDLGTIFGSFLRVKLKVASH
jgi:tetratricopeptide (TPR) repeat protein